MESRPGEDAEMPLYDANAQAGFSARAFENDAKIFLGDVINMVNDYCVEGFDAFDMNVREDPSMSMETKVAILEGIQSLYKQVERAMDANLEQWERNALEKIFALPAKLLLPPSQAPAVANSVQSNPGEEQALDAELQELRERIEKATMTSAAMKRELRALDREIVRCTGQAERMKAVAQPGGGSNVGEVAGQVAGIAARLQPLLARAEQLKNQRKGPLTGLGDHAPGLPGPSRSWLDNLQIGPPEDIARLHASFRAQPAVSSRSEQDSKSQASVQPGG